MAGLAARSSQSCRGLDPSALDPSRASPEAAGDQAGQGRPWQWPLLLRLAPACPTALALCGVCECQQLSTRRGAAGGGQRRCPCQCLLTGAAGGGGAHGATCCSISGLTFLSGLSPFAFLGAGATRPAPSGFLGAISPTRLP